MCEGYILDTDNPWAYKKLADSYWLDSSDGPAVSEMERTAELYQQALAIEGRLERLSIVSDRLNDIERQLADVDSSETRERYRPRNCWRRGRWRSHQRGPGQDMDRAPRRRHDDVHHVLILGPDEYIASCGDGLYRTRDARQSWTQFDTDLDHRYFREAYALDSRLYAAATRSSPGTWGSKNGADAILVESTNKGETFEAVSYPGEPDEVVLAWTAVDGDVLAGTDDGRIIRRDADGTWTDAGQVPAGIRSLKVC